MTTPWQPHDNPNANATANATHCRHQKRQYALCFAYQFQPHRNVTFWLLDRETEWTATGNSNTEDLAHAVGHRDDSTCGITREQTLVGLMRSIKQHTRSQNLERSHTTNDEDHWLIGLFDKKYGCTKPARITWHRIGNTLESVGWQAKKEVQQVEERKQRSRKHRIEESTASLEA